MLEKIVDIILNYVEPDDEITPDTRIKSELGMSSFDLVCFGDDLYDEFGVKIGADDFRRCNTVGKLAAYIGANC